MVLETAEQHLAITELAQLAAHLQGQKIGTGRFAKRYSARRMSSEQKLRLVKFLVDEGLPNSRIATQLGMNVRSVSRYRSKLQERA
jgi:transposase-like protein